MGCSSREASDLNEVAVLSAVNGGGFNPFFKEEEDGPELINSFQVLQGMGSLEMSRGKGDINKNMSGTQAIVLHDQEPLRTKWYTCPKSQVSHQEPEVTRVEQDLVTGQSKRSIYGPSGLVKTTKGEGEFSCGA